MRAHPMLGLAGLLAVTSSLAGPLADAQRKAVEWLKDHYAAQERGECLESPCPMAKGWKLISIDSGPDAISIAFSSPTPAPKPNVLSYRGMPALEKERVIRDTFCPYAGLDVWKILPENYAIQIVVSDAAAGLMGKATCSRRITR